MWDFCAAYHATENLWSLISGTLNRILGPRYKKLLLSELCTFAVKGNRFRHDCICSGRNSLHLSLTNDIRNQVSSDEICQNFEDNSKSYASKNKNPSNYPRVDR